MSLISLDMDDYSGKLHDMLLEVVEITRTDPEMCRMYGESWAGFTNH